MDLASQRVVAPLLARSVLLASFLAPTAFAGEVVPVERFDFAIDAGQIRNGPEPDGTTDSPATGFGHFVFDPLAERLDFAISWSGLDGDLTKLHVHGAAEPEESDPNHLFEILNSVQDVIDAEVDPRDDVFVGSIPLSEDAMPCADEAGTTTTAAAGTLACLREGLAYVNVHTTSFPMGEIRGQIVPLPQPARFRLATSADRVRNGPGPGGTTTSEATGSGLVTYDRVAGTLAYRFSWVGLEGDLTKLHVHGPAGAEASNPNHLFEMLNAVQDVIDAELDPRDDVFEGAIALPADGLECEEEAGDTETAAAATLPCLLERRAYLNVHTTSYPMGEIRGNVVLPEPGGWVGGGVVLLTLVAAHTRRERRGRRRHRATRWALAGGRR